ncbi:CWC26 [Candida pseudojiufengensis]|uniref:CWC26 n=1 Tax=Candida pseudojiufengensis TaxID=497109 RepID=UPI002225584F|nr:CWC26 [Candida pseudojiufengensis]KAI5962404.1 CWC26 [Candida pseudojiufengensis]
MSRADYLAKYMNNTQTETKKVKKKKKKVPEITSNITISKTESITPILSHKTEDLDEILPEEELDEESKPVTVTNLKENKGFKRIDNGTITKLKPLPTSSSTSLTKVEKPLVQQETVYRDSSGRIVDIKEAEENYTKRKQEEIDSKSKTEVRTSKEDQLKQESTKFKPKLNSNFEDPANAFIDEKIEIEDKTKSKFIYTKGVNLPNRFNIPAGFFWDGIDRSNGFEELMLRKINEQNYNKVSTKINEDYEIVYD